ALLGVAVDALAGSQGYGTNGEFTKMGASAGVLRYSAPFELEADYVGMYIMARAGFDITQAPGLWRRMSLENPQGIYNSTTHPTHAERFVALNKTINEITSKKKIGMELLPERQQMQEAGAPW
ncbi:MAG: peptidase M48 Ste24p, partial [Proteobacteria bacterium]|nr:peptidase M48 Ste24p [Pseudomonadota bacterium]